VYAGAAREAVFSVPAVIRRVKADFVPLALRAPLVNGAQAVRDADERWLYQRINRAKLAPQGICVLNSAGQVLTWVQMFDDDQSVLGFLDHGLKRFRDKADAKEPVATERYMRFPSDKLEDLHDETKLPPVIAAEHPKGKRCPAQQGKGNGWPGGLVARLVGRALDEQGKPVTEVVRQEHYVEDQFGVSSEVQKALAQALADAGTQRVRLPDAFGKLCATHAHLGHIDVRPCMCLIKDRAENKGEWKRCAFWARRAAPGKETVLWRVEGESEVVSEVAINGPGVHNVKLTWEGFVEVQGNRLTRLVLAARGTEKLQFAKDDHPLKKVAKDEVAFLPAGRPIDVEGGVSYGILGEAAAAEAEAPAGAAEPAEQVPDEARKPLVEALGGGTFIIFRDKVQDELKLSDEQRQKLMATFPEHVRETMKVFEQIKDLKPQEREQHMQEHRRKSDAKLSTFLKDVLDGNQQKRLLQVQLQQAGVFALLGQNEAFLPLKITEEQRRKFMEVVQEMQQKIQPLVEEAEAGGKPEEIMPKVMKIRKEHEGKIETLLSATQKKQWKELLGKPFDLGD
jgi:hypothetical protein